MKRKLLLILFWIASLPMFAQVALTVSGTVNNSNGGTPVVNHPVTIMVDSLASPNPYATVYTNPNGYYTATLPLYGSLTVVTVTVSTYDCQNYQWLYNQTVTVNSGGAATTQNFLICYNPPSCEAGFIYNFLGNRTFQFMDVSTGSNNIWSWSFGDGTSSNDPNPLHTYLSSGYYAVSLTIGAAGTPCWDTITQYIYVTDSTASSCQAQFTYNVGGSGNVVYFTDLSTHTTPITWLWDFGDGTYSTLQNPVHTYPPNVPPMPYTACLIITSADSSCNSTSCQTIIAGTPGSCQANFETLQIPGAFNTFQFTDFSQGMVQTWTWDFGDGNSATINSPQNPNIVHSYLNQGVYTACLNIITLDSCTSSYCQSVYVTDTIAGCQAYYQAVMDSLNPGLVNFYDLSQGNPVAWFWNFGDGTSSTLQNPVHQFQVNGPYSYYNVCLTITGANGCADTYCQTIVVTGNQGCQADFDYYVVPPHSPNLVQFTDASTYSGLVSWFWDFGDGGSSTEQNPVHSFPSYPTYASYLVCLTITDSLNACTSTYCKVVTIGTQSCSAYFETSPGPNPAPGTNSLSVSFNDLSTGNIQTWTWSFGDGTGEVINGPGNPDILHTYPAPGYYYATLTISGDSCSSSYAQTVMVVDTITSCQAQFSYYPLTGSYNTIQFLDLSYGSWSQYYWNFGDGTSSTEFNPMHTYSNPGIFNVCLTISGTNCQSTWCSTVEVGSNPSCVNYFTFSNIGLTVNFSGHVTDSLPGSVTYTWEFGDNQTGDGQDVLHTYSAPGVYYVTLTTAISDNQGYICYAYSSQMVNVGDTVVWSQVYGQVFAGNFPLQQGIAMLFSVDTLGSFVPFVNVAPIDSAGMFYFSMVPQGNFILYAIPFEYGYLPTYFGNVLYWEDASVLNLGTPVNPYYINLIDASSLGSGSGTIQGQISGGDIANSLIDKVTMLLKDEYGNVVLFKQVDIAGNFDFPQLPFGTYYLYAELAGCSTQAIKVVISEASPTAQVNLTLSGGSINGQKDLIALEAGVVYPNPVKETAKINITLTNATNVSLSLFNMAGQQVLRMEESLGTGQNTVIVPTATLTGGVYTLKISTPEGLLISRKLVK